VYEVTLTVERGEREIELTVVGEVTPLRRGRYCGPPEKCYPDEGGQVEICEVLHGGKSWDGDLDESERRQAEEKLQQAFDDAMADYADALAEERYEDRQGT
jgi:hypothetical protein